MEGAGLPWVWGATASEVERSYPADALVGGRTMVMTRAVDVRAPAATAYRWLCQLRHAPYSYDWVDNRGRRSPRTLTPGPELAVGDRVVTVYEVTDVDPGRSWSGVTTPSASRLFGTLGVTYAAEPAGVDTCRLVCRMVLRGDTRVRRAFAAALAWGDLVMLRKQLRNLAACAEQDASRAQRGDDGGERAEGGCDGADPVGPQQP